MTIIRWMRRTTTGRCRIWVKLGPQARSDRRPFIPQQPTYGDCNDVSVLCPIGDIADLVLK